MIDIWQELREQALRFGAAVLQARLDLDMSQADVVHQVNRMDPWGPHLDVPTLSRIERGTALPADKVGAHLTSWLRRNLDPDILLPIIDPHARTSDPSTSHLAADSVDSIKIRNLHFWWLRHLDLIWRDPNTIEQLNLDGDPRGYFATDEGARKFYDGPKVSDSGFRTRRAELRRAGLVEDSGIRFKISTGRHAIAWKLTPLGVTTMKETPQP